MSTDIEVSFTEPRVNEIAEQFSQHIKINFAKTILRSASKVGGIIAKYAITLLNKHGTGHLARSFLPAVFIKKSDTEISAGALSDEKYANIHNDGGTIYPSSKKYLAIPMTNTAKKMWPRDWSSGALTFIQPKNGNPILVSDDSVEYLLRRSVKIKPTHYIDKAHLEAMATIPQDISDELEPK